MAVAAATTGRAAAELTTGEVQGADCDLQDSLNGFVAISLSITIASLTSVTLRCYAGEAATPTDTLAPNGVLAEYVYTGDTETQVVVPVAGCRYFRASVQGAGTVAGSSCAFTYRYLDYETTSRVGGHPQIG